MEDVVFYDLQRDIYIEDEREYLEFAGHYLSSFGQSKMHKLGLLDAHGRPLF